MRTSVASAMQWSSELFRELIWPAFRDELGGGQLLPVEDVGAHPFAALLDTHAGIDAFTVHKGRGIIPLSSRVQRWDARFECHDSWTIRTRRSSGTTSEHERLLRSPDTHYLRPSFHIQAYVQTSGFFRAAMILTRDLVDELRAGVGSEKTPDGRPLMNPEDGTPFVAVWWKVARRNGRRVVIRERLTDAEQDSLWSRCGMCGDTGHLWGECPAPLIR